MSIGTEEDKQKPRGAGQQQGTVGEDQPVAQIGQLAGGKAVLGENGGKPREARKTGIGGKDQNGGGGCLDHEIQRATAEDSPVNLREYGLSDGLSVLRNDSKVVGKERDGNYERTQNGGHPEERDGSVS